MPQSWTVSDKQICGVCLCPVSYLYFYTVQNSLLGNRELGHPIEMNLIKISPQTCPQGNPIKKETARDFFPKWFLSFFFKLIIKSDHHTVVSNTLGPPVFVLSHCRPNWQQYIALKYVTRLWCRIFNLLQEAITHWTISVSLTSSRFYFSNLRELDIHNIFTNFNKYWEVLKAFCYRFFYNSLKSYHTGHLVR